MMKTVLLLAANPQGTQRINLDGEARAITEQLQMSRARDEFKLARETAVRIDDLERAVRVFQPNIIHFSGHGLRAGLILEDDRSGSRVVSTKALAEFFALYAEQVECVVLNACYSKPQAGAIGRHIKYVVGMRKEIGDEAAVLFSEGFYGALFDRRSVEDAFKFGINKIKIRDIPENSTPVLHVREQDVLALPIDPPPPALPTDEPIKIFISFAPNDNNLRAAIDVSLTTLKRQNLIKCRSDDDALSGSERDAQNAANLNEAQIILLLISNNYLAAKYDEMERAMARHDKGEAYVIPILLSEGLYENLPFARLVPLPPNGLPVRSWTRRSDAIYEIANGIKRVVENMNAR